MDHNGSQFQNLNRLSRLQLEQLIIHLKSELSQAKIKLDDYEENYEFRQIKNLKKENEKLSAKLEYYQSVIDENKDQIDNFEVLTNNLKAKLANVQMEMDGYKTKIQKSKAERSGLQNKFVEMENKMVELQMQLKEKTDIYEKEIQHKDELIQKNAMNTTKYKMVEKELRQLVIALTEELYDEVIDINEEFNFAKVSKKKTIDMSADTEELHKKLSDEKKKREILQQEMQMKISQLTFIQNSGEGITYRQRIENLINEINKDGKNISLCSLNISKLEKELSKIT